MVRISVPAFQNLDGICRFSEILKSYEDDEVELDFSNIGFARPSGMILLSKIIGSHVRRGSKVIPVHFESATYPRNMGFFTACGLDLEPLANAPGNNNYFPVEKYSCHSIRNEADQFRENAGETVERLSGKLSGILCRDYDSEIYKVIKYSLREIIRNIVEHSESDDFSVCGQYWPASGEVELAIFDNGIGIKRGLSTNPHISVENDYHALQMALLPGISGKSFEGARIEKKTEWTNSGFGLFMTSQICRRGGEFIIGSGESALSLIGDKKKDFAFGIGGTAIILAMKVSDLPRTHALLHSLSKRGESIAKMIGGSVNVEASTASKLLMS